MHSNPTLSFVASKRADPLDGKTWRMVLLSGLARRDEGIVLCDAEGEILFASGRANELLGKLGAGGHELPPAVEEVVRRRREATLDGRTGFERVSPPSGGLAVLVDPHEVRTIPPVRTIVWIREERMRDSDLYAKLGADYGLSARSCQVVQLLRQGLSNREIAATLGLTESTVKAYLHEVYRACSVSSRTSLVALVERIARGA